MNDIMINRKLEKWNCRNCKLTLGHVEDKKIVRIKRKDVYVEIEIIKGKAKISYNCCRCGLRNTLEYEDIKGGEENV